MPDAPTQDFWNIALTRLDRALTKIPKKGDGSHAWGTLKVGHLDTGYTRHPALGFPVTGDSPWVLNGRGRDFFDNKHDPKDALIDTPWQPRGHGTRTASALCGDNEHIKGYAPRLPIVPYRVADDSLIGKQTARAIGRAIHHAIEENGCQIISISLGFPLLDEGFMGEGIDLAYQKGVIVVGACGQMIDKVCYPAKSCRAIGVGGIAKADGKMKIYYQYDSYARVDIFAPAQPIWRATLNNQTDWTYGAEAGTSYAVPHIVAAAAMWLVHRGTEIRGKYAKPWMRIEAFRRLLRSTQRLPGFKFPPDCRARMLDAEALLDAPLPDIVDNDFEEDTAASDRV